MRRIIIVLVIVIVSFIIWKLASFKMFDVESVSLSKIPIQGRNFVIDINYISAGATIEDVIQVRRLYENGKFDVVRNIKEYNSFLSADLVGGSLLKLVVSDTGYYKRGPDTIMIKF